MTIAKGFLCTGTLIAPNYVLTAGHCGSITGGAGVASPAAYPAAADRRQDRLQQARPGRESPVSRVTLHPNYLLNDGYDISMLKL